MLLPFNDILALFAHFYTFFGLVLLWDHIWTASQVALFHKYTFLVQVHLTR